MTGYSQISVISCTYNSHKQGKNLTAAYYQSQNQSKAFDTKQGLDYKQKLTNEGSGKAHGARQLEIKPMRPRMAKGKLTITPSVRWQFTKERGDSSAESTCLPQCLLGLTVVACGVFRWCNGYHTLHLLGDVGSIPTLGELCAFLLPSFFLLFRSPAPICPS